MSCSKKLEIKKWFLQEFTATIKDSNWTAIDLSSYDDVKFIMATDSWNIKVNATATFVSKPNWQVSYTFVSTDVDQVWDYKAYFAFYISWEKKLSSPTTYFQVVINDDYL